jgi:hypothetical protein
VFGSFDVLVLIAIAEAPPKNYDDIMVIVVCIFDTKVCSDELGVISSLGDKPLALKYLLDTLLASFLAC